MAETDLDRANAARIKQLDTLDKLAQRFGQSLSTAMTRSLSSGRQLDGVLGSLGTRLAGTAVQGALKPVRTGIASLVNRLLGSGVGADEAFARGGVLQGGRVRAFAAGGVVAAPTYFPMSVRSSVRAQARSSTIFPSENLKSWTALTGSNELLKAAVTSRLQVGSGRDMRGGSLYDFDSPSADTTCFVRQAGIGFVPGSRHC